jgi:hypothetical protein
MKWARSAEAIATVEEMIGYFAADLNLINGPARLPRVER